MPTRLRAEELTLLGSASGTTADSEALLWPAGEGDHGSMQSDHEGSRCAEAVRD